ncbi:hypothetical protein Tco_0998995 [Tanacetum coccineum]
MTWARFRKKLDKNTTLQARDFHSEAFTKSAQKVELFIKVVTSQVVEMASRFASDAEELIRASRLKKVMVDKGKKSSMEIFTPNDKADYYSGITSITANGKNAYELKGKFLDDLHNNAFSGTNEKDAVEHIEYYL